MRMLKKAVLILIILFITCFGSNQNVYATISCAVSITGDTSVKAGDKFTVTVSISNIQTSRGIVAMDGNLEYDKSKLEFVSMSSCENWSSPSYNSSNGKFITDRGEFGKKAEAVFRITFKAIEGAAGDASIKLNSISIADGEEEDNVASTSKVVNIQGSNKNNVSTNKNNTNKNVQTNKNTSKNNNVVAVEQEVPENNIEQNEEDENISDESNEINDNTEIREEIKDPEPQRKPEDSFKKYYIYYGIGAILAILMTGGAAYFVISKKKSKHGSKNADRIDIEKVDK